MFLTAATTIMTMVFLAVGEASAQSIPDLFMVPVVRLTNNGAAVLQPQTGDGYGFLQTNNTTGAISGSVSSANSGYLMEAGSPSNFSGGSSYVPPRYDAFADGSANMKVQLPQPAIKSVDTVDFNVRNDLPGSNDPYSGTTHTIFTFTADVTSKYFREGDLEYRWDFNNDGIMDSYFSSLDSITHTYNQPGTYEVKLQVLDSNGGVSSVIKRVYVAENDAPLAYFKVDKLAAPVNDIFRFDSSYSSDNQYPKTQLSYRFDWDGDGVFDTDFQNKTVWNHLYREVGNYTVIMQVADPEGLTAMAKIGISVQDDLPPTANLSVAKVSDFNYLFDASQSSDDHTPAGKLKFRWDFNYSGPNDIIFDTSWSNSPKVTGYYRIGGSKMIRLQVMDEQGLIDQAFAQISVPWTEQYVNLAVDMLHG